MGGGGAVTENVSPVHKSQKQTNETIGFRNKGTILLKTRVCLWGIHYYPLKYF